MTDLSPKSEVVVTVKYGKGYEEPWVVFHGPDVDAVKRQLIEFFGMSPESMALSGHSIVVNARSIAQGMGVIADAFPGAMVVSEEESASLTPPPEPTPAAENPLLAKIEAQTTRDDLVKLWAENKAAFDADATLMDAYRAKGKSLPA